jgi:glucokinase
MSDRRILAIDCGGTKTASALIDSSGAIHEKRKDPAIRNVTDLAALITGRAADAAAVGILVPGIYNGRSGTAWCPNLWDHDEIPLARALAAGTALPLVIESDRSGYVLGEQWLGAARGLQDVAFASFGTGIGVGILSGGRLLTGAHGIAGAAGWFALTPEWRDDYARTGCWEAEAAGPALARRFHVSQAEQVVAAAIAGDPRARAVLDETSEWMAMGLANLVSLLDPEMIVLGGGLMQAGTVLLDRIRQRMARWAQPVAFKKTRLELTQLGEDAGLLGAARLAFLATGIHTGEGVYVSPSLL